MSRRHAWALVSVFVALGSGGAPPAARADGTPEAKPAEAKPAEVTPPAAPADEPRELSAFDLAMREYQREHRRQAEEKERARLQAKFEELRKRVAERGKDEPQLWVREARQEVEAAARAMADAEAQVKQADAEAARHEADADLVAAGRACEEAMGRLEQARKAHAPAEEIQRLQKAEAEAFKQFKALRDRAYAPVEAANTAWAKQVGAWVDARRVLVEAETAAEGPRLAGPALAAARAKREAIGRELEAAGRAREASREAADKTLEAALKAREAARGLVMEKLRAAEKAAQGQYTAAFARFDQAQAKAFYEREVVMAKAEDEIYRPNADPARVQAAKARWEEAEREMNRTKVRLAEALKAEEEKSEQARKAAREEAAKGEEAADRRLAAAREEYERTAKAADAALQEKVAAAQAALRPIDEMIDRLTEEAQARLTARRQAARTDIAAQYKQNEALWVGLSAAERQRRETVDLRHQRLQAALPARVRLAERRLPQVRFNRTGLGDVLDFLADVTGEANVADWPTLAKVGVTRDTPITLAIDNPKVLDALGRVLDEAAKAGGKGGSLKAGGAGRVLVISTPEGLADWERRLARLQKVMAADPKAEMALSKALPELKFNANGLADVIDFLRDVTGLNLFVNWRTLEEEGIGKDAPVTLHAVEVPLGEAILLILRAAGIRGEVGGDIGVTFDDGVVTIGKVQPAAP